MTAYLDLLKNNRGYTKLWLAQVVSLTGDWFNTIVLSALVADYSDGSGLAISIFLMARFLPPLLIGPFAGVLVDRFNRKQILIWCNALRVGVVLLFLLADNPDTLWLIYVLTIAQFTLSAFFEPAQSAITPSLIRRKYLVVANTLASITWSSMLAVGAIIGGIVSAVFGAEIAIIIDAITFGVAALFILSIKASEINENVISEDDDEDIHDDAIDEQETGSFLDGLRYLRRNPLMAAVALVKGAGSIGNVDLLITVIATQVFILGDNGQLSLGILYSAFGLGAMAGPLLLNRFNDGTISRMRQLVAIGFFSIIVGWIFFGTALSLWVASMAMFVRAMGGSSNWTYSSVIIQKSVPDRYLGRVFSLDLAFFQLATVMSTLVHGYLLDIISSNNTVTAFMNNATMDRLSEQIMLGVGSAHGVQLIAYGTGIIALIPLVLWLWALPKMERRDRHDTNIRVQRKLDRKLETVGE